MKLVPGQHAPDFSVEDTEGKRLSLADYRGQKLLLCFFRYAGCPFCNLSLQKLLDRYALFAERGLRVIAFFQSPAKSVDRYPGKLKPPFPLVADPKRMVYEKYGVESSVGKTIRGIIKIPQVYADLAKHHLRQEKIDGDPFLVPAYFLIGPAGDIIYAAYYGADFTDMIPFIQIEDFLLFDKAWRPPEV